MAKTYLQPGDMLDVTAPGTVAAGNAVTFGTIVGVAQHDAATGAHVTIATRGVYRMQKDGSTVAEGAALYATAAGLVTTTSSGNTLIGAAYRAAAGGDATVEVYVRGKADFEGRAK